MGAETPKLLEENKDVELVKNAKMFQYVVRFFFRNADITQGNGWMRMMQNPLQHRNILGRFVKPVAKRFS
ncbi:cell division protein YceG involved in septum cleavage [Bacillus sp. V2I10]|nr:cell division protein YceG involved in septum cleavage [Bacillus sp. V2I10]